MVDRPVLTMSDTVLVMVDAQVGFVTEYTSTVLPHVGMALEDDRWGGKVATMFVNHDHSRFRDRLGYGDMAPGSPEGELLDVVKDNVAPDMVEWKFGYGLGDPGGMLASTIRYARREGGARDVLLMGFDTDICVAQLAGDLFSFGIPVWVDVAGCATAGGPDADAAAVGMLERIVGADYVVNDYRTVAV